MSEAPEDSAVVLTVTAPVAHIELNRPTKLNALNPECLDLLEKHIEAAEADDDVRVVIISGRGRFFCAGADLRVVEQAQAQNRFKEFLLRWHEAFARIERCTKPTIAAVHGMALAGGFELTQVCDLVVIGDSTQIGDQHAKFGLFPGGGSTQRLPRLVGKRAATWMLLSGEAVSPEQAVTLGLANEIAPETEVVARAHELAKHLAERSVAASSAIKYALRQTADLSLAEGIAVELEVAVAHMASPDAAAGLTAFTSRSTPDFGYQRPVAG